MSEIPPTGTVNRTTKPIFATFALLFLTVGLTFAAPPEQPNIVVIFIDDMGYGDVGFKGK